MRAFVRHPLTQIAFAVLTFCIGVLDSILYRQSLQLSGNDFGKFYYGTQAWLAGSSLYSPNPATHLRAGDGYFEFLDMNPPHFHLLVLPLVHLRLSMALAIWTAINVGAGCAAMVIILRELGVRTRAWLVLPTLCLSLLSGPTTAILVTGQFTGLLMLPMTLAWRHARRQHWTAAGGWLGAIISVKPFLGLFLPYIVLVRQWTAMRRCISVAAALFVCGLLFWGRGETLAWIAALRNVHWVWGAMNGSLQAIVVRAFTETPYFRPAIVAPSLVLPLWIAGSIMIGALTFRTALRSVDHAFAAMVLGALLISPLGQVYYLWLALPPCLALWRHARPWVLWPGLACAAIPVMLPAIGGRESPLLTLTLGSVYTWGTLLLWAAVVRTPMRDAVQYG
jgi:hypothetical protein